MGKDSLITPGSMLDNALDAMYEDHKVRKGDPEGYAREEAEIRWKPLLMGFYNLQIQSGPIYDHDLVFHESDFDYTKALFEELNEDDVETVLPDAKQRKAIIKFISQWVTGSMLPGNEEVQAEYFESIHFLRFCDEYLRTKQFIDDYMSGSGHIRGLQWLASRLGTGRQTIRARYADKDDPHKDIDRSGDVLEWQYKEDESDCIKFSDYSFYRSWEIDNSSEQAAYYGGVSFSNFFGNIHIALSDMLEERWGIGKCSLEGCDNIFMTRPSGKPRQYCTDSHRVMAHRKRKQVAAM